MEQLVLDFWFKEIEPAQWWVKDEAFDLLISSKFQDIHKAATRGELYKWRSTAKGRLAEVIVLDQFSRNMFRNTSESFAYDPLALILAQETISLSLDKELSKTERSFLYMPFMHSESLIIHEKAVELYQSIDDPSKLAFELKHKVIIEQFGRYPHRNSILCRQSTPEEEAFLKQPDSSF